ncbi:hypothetical protein CQW23_23781 [Capsicum baccatum]|uniref:NB-ARC domain-containing protein n=1 Tax=Capsicum baccatum TaxID=33114 RepID=A0A2G2VSY0_CAPBA|nr:hypothetical protein CQW23_23781 [Capsicum baccatum]
MRLWKKVAAIASDVLYIIQKLLLRSIGEDKASGTGDIYSMQVLEKTKYLKAPVKSYYKSLKFTPSQFHHTFGGLRFLDSLLSKLNEVLKSKSDLDFLKKPLFDNLKRYNRRDLLQKIFSQVTGSMDKRENDDVLADKLRKNLIINKYLGVLDDIWDGIEWDNLRLCFPDGGKHCVENGLFFSYKMKIFLPQGWYEKGIFSTFLSGNKTPSWFTKLVVRSILKENLFEDYYVQTASSESGVEE